MTLLQRLEAALAHGAVRLLRALGPERASNLGGAVARAIGPLLPVSKVAHRNLRFALPELDAAARRRIVRGVWDNLGRTAAELPHVASLSETDSGPGWEIVGGEHAEAVIASGGPAMLFSGHFGNWEVLPLATARRGLSFATVYRPADNPAIDALIVQLRRNSAGANEKLFPKGSHGARLALMHLRAGGSIGLLGDQKMNDGIPARLFGQIAMTASAPAALALKVGCPMYSGHVLRTGPCRFRVIFEGPMAMPDTGDRATDIAELTQTANDRLEGWIRGSPESWLWLHRRWPKQIYVDGS